MSDDQLRDELADILVRELKDHPAITARSDEPDSWGVIGVYGGMSPLELANALLPVIRRHVEQAQTVAWNEGFDAGQVNEHEFRPGRRMFNSYWPDDS